MESKLGSGMSDFKLLGVQAAKSKSAATEDSGDMWGLQLDYGVPAQDSIGAPMETSAVTTPRSAILKT